MATVTVRYLGPSTEVYVPDLGVEVERNATIEVSEAFAGREPDGTDLGTGLLAQVGVWERVTAPKARPGTTTTAAPAATPEV